MHKLSTSGLGLIPSKVVSYIPKQKAEKFTYQLISWNCGIYFLAPRINTAANVRGGDTVLC